MQIQSLDMAAAVIAATGQRPVINGRGDGGRLGFAFPEDAAISDAVARYVTGELLLPAKHLLQVRGELYKQLRGAK